MRYLNSGEICKELKITTMTLKRWKDSGTIEYKKITSKKYLYDIESILKDTVRDNRINIIYSRVSNTKQKDDLFRQSNLIKEYMIRNGIKPDLIFEEVSSGMNENRKKFNEILDLVFGYKVDTVYISYKDRLTRFGFDYFSNIFKKFGTKIEILNITDESSFQNELTKDLISIIHHFSIKLYSNRRKKFKEISEKIKEIDNSDILV